MKSAVKFFSILLALMLFSSCGVNTDTYIKQEGDSESREIAAEIKTSPETVIAGTEATAQTPTYGINITAPGAVNGDDYYNNYSAEADTEGIKLLVISGTLKELYTLTDSLDTYGTSDDVSCIVESQAGSWYVFLDAESTFENVELESNTDKPIVIVGMYLGIDDISGLPSVAMLKMYSPIVGEIASEFMAEYASEIIDTIAFNVTPPDNADSGTGSAQTSQQTTVTFGMQNALQQAKSYISVMAFSHKGLVDQLEYSGYTADEAKYGADNCGADWYDQAAKKAKEYIDVMAFSYSGLIDQLEYSGFTHEEAVHGVDNCGADWYDQAVKKAKEYLDVMAFSRSRLIDQLQYSGFTADQATHAADEIGY